MNPNISTKPTRPHIIERYLEIAGKALREKRERDSKKELEDAYDRAKKII